MAIKIVHLVGTKIVRDFSKFVKFEDAKQEKT